jgi:hypothetical protein
MKIFYLKFHFSYPFRALRARTVCVVRLTINVDVGSVLSAVVVRLLSNVFCCFESSFENE